MKTNVLTLLALLLIGMLTAQTPQGELKRWHKITLDFEGPNTSELASTNPFSDYRLDVTFTNGNATYIVPGFYSGCSNPADTSCDSGNIWKVNFAPDRTGTWSWTASFKTGSDVAINGGGSSVSFDGDSGSFVVAESDKSGRDFRSPGLGRLQYVGEHYLKHSGTTPDTPNGPWFVKAGADSPENAFNYEDFDATPDYENSLNKIGNKTWEPHQQDYDASDAGDYTWANGKGTEMLGTINYIASEGSNAMSFLTWNTAGDGGAVFPHLFTGDLDDYTDPSIYKNSAQWDLVEKDRFDVSKLAQWEKIMEYADKRGVYLHFKTMETENDNLMDSNSFGRERKLYYRELIARFGHHLALNWNLTEETTLPDDLVIDTAEYIKSIDAYDHHIVIHTYPSQKSQRYTPLLGNNSELTGPSLQSNVDDVHDDVIDWRAQSAEANKKWVVANDEQGPASLGIRIDEKEVRYLVLYGTLMAGGAGVEYYYGYTDTDGDINNQDHRLRGDIYKQSGYALDFFNNYLQDYLTEMESSDGVTADNDDYVLAKAGEVYAVYRPDGGSTNISLPTGDWSVQWYNPRTGGGLTSAETLTGSLVAPDNNDWVALITNDGVDSICDVYEEQDGVVIIEAENRNIDFGEWEVKTTELSNSFTGNSYLEFTGNSVINGDPNSPIEYQFKINDPGLYALHLRCARENVTIDGEVRTDVANDCYVRVDGDYNEGPSAGDSHGDQAPLESLKSDTKFFGGNDNSFVWASGNRLDLGGHTNKRQAIYDFKAGETYTLVVSGRSQLFKLDRIMFRKTTVNTTEAESLDNVETFSDECDDNNENNAPTVEIDTPANNAIFDEGVDIAFNANAFDSDGTIEQVQFFVNGTLLKTERVIPYTATMSGYAEGTYNITAVATDNDGATTTSAVVTITIGNTPISEAPIGSTIWLQAYTGDYVRIDAGDDDLLDAASTNNETDISSFLIEDAGDGLIALKSIANDLYVAAEIRLSEDTTPLIADRANLGLWEKFEWIENSDGSISLKSVITDKYVAADATQGNDRPLIANRDAIGPWEKFNWGVTSTVSIATPTILAPIHDAYLQGNTKYNSQNVRVENGNRVGYLMFDLSNIDGTIETLNLEFTIFSDPGNGNLNVYLGDSNNWTEDNLSSTNKPEQGALLGSLNTTYNLGSTYNVSLDRSAVTGDVLSLVLVATSGNDFDFGSKENTNLSGPELKINDESLSKNDNPSLANTIAVYPNPTTDIINFSGNVNGATVKVYNVLGSLKAEMLVKEGNTSLDMQDLVPGIYLVSILNTSGGQSLHRTIKVVKK